MGSPISSLGGDCAATRFRIFSIFVALTTLAGGVLSSSGFENRQFSEDEVNSLRAAVSEFAIRLPNVSKSVVASISDLTLERVRFVRYYGYVGNAFNQGFSFRVAIDVHNPDNNRVVSFTDKSQRNILDDCDSETSDNPEYVGMRTANESALRFLELQNLRRLTEELSQERAELGCIGSEKYYRFVWRERYDDDGVARMLARVELLINPATARVFSFNCTLSRLNNQHSFDPGMVRESLSSSEKLAGAVLVDRMALFVDHSRDGSTRPVWAVTLKRIEGDKTSENLVFVDARSGRILDDR